MPVCSGAKARSSGTQSISGAASASGTTSASGSTEREEGEETDKYKANDATQYMLRLGCSAGLSKDATKSL